MDIYLFYFVPRQLLNRLKTTKLTPPLIEPFERGRKDPATVQRLLDLLVASHTEQPENPEATMC